MQKRLAIVFSIIVVLIIAVVVLLKITSYVPENDPYTTGNTSGNLLNGGLFCEDDGIVYFSNVNDNGYLYSMNENGSDLKCLLKAPVSYINSAGKYLYFYQEANKENGAFGSLVRTMGIYRMKKGSKNTPDCLDRTPAKILSLCGSDLFYEHYDTATGIKLYKVSIQGGDRHPISEADINPACVIDGNIYFPNMEENFYLSCFKPETETADIIISDMKVYNLVYDNGFIYYMNVSDDYKLYRYGLNERYVTKLTDCRVDAFNVLNNVIVYQKNGKDDAALIRMNADGSGTETIASGNYTGISMTSNYIYFTAFGEDLCYRVPLSGGGVERFDVTVSQ